MSQSTANESTVNESTKDESTKAKQFRSWLPWAAGLLILIGAGAVAWIEFFPDASQRLVAIEVADQNSLSQGKPGVHNRIPIRVTNRTNHPIRIVGNNAC